MPPSHFFSRLFCRSSAKCIEDSNTNRRKMMPCYRGEECFTTTPLACPKVIELWHFGPYLYLLTLGARKGLTKSFTVPILMLCHLGKGVSRNPSLPLLGLLAPLAFRTLAAWTHAWGEEDFKPVATLAPGRGRPNRPPALAPVARGEILTLNYAKSYTDNFFFIWWPH